MSPPNRFCSTIPTVENVLNATHFVKRNATHLWNRTLRSGCNQLVPTPMHYGRCYSSEDPLTFLRIWFRRILGNLDWYLAGSEKAGE